MPSGFAYAIGRAVLALAARMIGLSMLKGVAEAHAGEQRVGPHIDPGERRAKERAEFREHRLGVAHPAQIPRDRPRCHRRCIALEPVVGATGAIAANAASAAAMPDSMALCEPLMRGTFIKPSGASDQHAARERKLADRLPAALGQSARAIADAPAALECVADRRVRLEALEFV